MIALVDLLPPPCARLHTASLEDLPAPPAVAFSGFFVRCRSKAKTAEFLKWLDRIRKKRPAIPVGLVADESACGSLFATCPHPLTVLLDPRWLVGGGLPPSALDDLALKSIEHRVLEEMCATHGPRILKQRAAIEAVIARGVKGGTIEGAARTLNVSPETIRRRLAAVSLSPRRTAAMARLRAYEIRVESGVDSKTALLAGGWRSAEARRKMARRSRLNSHASAGEEEGTGSEGRVTA